MEADPRSQVEAPVRGALVGVTVRGVVLVGVMTLLALWPTLAHPEVAVRDAIAIAALVVLAGYSVWVRAVAAITGRPPEDARAIAWDQAREVDREDAMLAIMVAGWVPVGLLVAIGLILWPHLVDPNPALAVAWVVLAMPPFTVAWLVATATWLEACRDDLARAEHESELRLRRYWANVGH